jgi:trehalose 6-phosphate synthase/phosphatase
VADIALVTPLRDGMNLVAKEYVAAKRDTPGVLILSERAGAAHELTDALLVNPNSAEEVSDAIIAAIEMPEKEQLARLQRMQALLARRSVNAWAAEFLHAQQAIGAKNDHVREALIGPEDVRDIRAWYRNARARLLILDYDGTLAPICKQPEDAAPDEALRGTLRRLAEDPRNTLVICSGRDRDTLDRWLGDLPVLLAAEHGAFHKESGVWHGLQDEMPVWDDEVLAVMERITYQTQGAWVEKKRTALVWHYRNVDAWLAELREKQLLASLMEPCARLNLRVMRGNKVVEVKPFDFNKGAEVQRLLEKGSFDFVLAMGDDVTDEDMFRALPPDSVTVKVGSFSPQARYTLGSQTETLPFLRTLADYLQSV